MGYPKICENCENKPQENIDLPYDLCGHDPRECSLAKARKVKRAGSVALATGRCVDDVLADASFNESPSQDRMAITEELFPDA